MNGAQLHLAVNHVPVMALVFGSLMFGIALLLKKEGLRQTALVLFVAAGLGAGAAFFSGEPAEEVVEDVPAVQETMIHDHEEAAELAAIATAIVAVLATGVLVAERRRAVAPWMNGLLLVAGVVTTGAMIRTAHLGGLIRHPELSAPGVAVDAARPATRDN
jgi:hypothetical protein